MLFHDVKDVPVVALSGAEKLGFVDSAFVDLSRGQILGFRIRRGGLVTHHEALLLTDVRSIGEDALTIDDTGRLNQEGKFSALRGASDIASLLGARVLTEAGTETGHVADVDFDLSTGTITQYVLSGSLIERLRHDQPTVAAAMVKSLGDKIVVVSDESTGDVEQNASQSGA